MIVKIPSLLSADDLRVIREKLAAATWQDGRATAGHQAVQVKQNQQLALDDPIAKEVGQMIIERLGQTPLFLASALPAQLLPPRFNRYTGGGTYGNHIDNALFPLPDNSGYVRTDLSCTLFLNEPDEYDGGELVITDHAHDTRIKWAAGDMVLYPSTSLHRVEPVTRGERLASFFWVQSLIRNQDQRDMLFTMDQAIQSLTQDQADDQAIASLTGVYHNLMRSWVHN
jgi:PKHD-type hydroxylase